MKYFQSDYEIIQFTKKYISPLEHKHKRLDSTPASFKNYYSAINNYDFTLTK